MYIVHCRLTFRVRLYLFVCTTTHCSLKAYCGSWLDVPIFATRRLRACHHARAPSGERWNCGREMSGNFAEMMTSTPFRDLLHAVKLRHGTDGFTSPPKEGVLRIFLPKNPTASAWCEPANLGTKGQHATSRTPKVVFTVMPFDAPCFLVLCFC